MKKTQHTPHTYLVAFICLCIPLFSFGQNNERGELEKSLQQSEAKLRTAQATAKKIKAEIEETKLSLLHYDLKKWGLPKLKDGEVLINHSALSLVYNEEYEQASWVAHIITPDVAFGNQGRSNDFRPDPLVKTGSSVEEDYFLKKKVNGKVVYDGFGYDRGHLAPSADFRWSAKALSESYFYSNMSPQKPEFNRECWADLEGFIRGYVITNKTQVYVVTGPVLKKGLPKVKRSVNKVSIPEKFYKCVYDPKNKRGIAFLMENKSNSLPSLEYAVSIDEVEKLTGIDFFHSLEDNLEKKVEGAFDKIAWDINRKSGDVEPLRADSLPRGHFNTTQVRLYMNDPKPVWVCGTVVSARRSAKGNVFLNLDKKFPNQVFSISVFKKSMRNFSFDPTTLKGKVICVRGRVKSYQGKPTMSIYKEEQLKVND